MRRPLPRFGLSEMPAHEKVTRSPRPAATFGPLHAAQFDWKSHVIAKPSLRTRPVGYVSSAWSGNHPAQPLLRLMAGSQPRKRS